MTRQIVKPVLIQRGKSNQGSHQRAHDASTSNIDRDAGMLGVLAWCCLRKERVRSMEYRANGGRPVPAFGVVRCNEADQLGPGNDLLHLLKEVALAGFLAVLTKVQGGLFHAMYFIATGDFLHRDLGVMKSFPKQKPSATSTSPQPHPPPHSPAQSADEAAKQSRGQSLSPPRAFCANTGGPMRKTCQTPCLARGRECRSRGI